MPASVVNGPVIKQEGEVRERGAAYGVGSPTDEPAAPEGTDPYRETGAMLAASILADGGNYAKRLLDAGRLDDAIKTLWRIIRLAEGAAPA